MALPQIPQPAAEQARFIEHQAGGRFPNALDHVVAEQLLALHEVLAGDPVGILHPLAEALGQPQPGLVVADPLFLAQ